MIAKGVARRQRLALFLRVALSMRRLVFADGGSPEFVSGSMTDILWPAMAALGVEHALCSEPVVVDDRA
jgi:hypothetical protein